MLKPINPFSFDSSQQRVQLHSFADQKHAVSDESVSSQPGLCGCLLNWIVRAGEWELELTFIFRAPTSFKGLRKEGNNFKMGLLSF